MPEKYEASGIFKKDDPWKGADSIGEVESNISKPPKTLADVVCPVNDTGFHSDGTHCTNCGYCKLTKKYAGIVGDELRCYGCGLTSKVGALTYEPVDDAVTRIMGDPRFHKALKEIGDLHDLKQQDYGSDTDPFANVRASQEWGVPPWIGAMIRLNDKVHRLQQLAKKGKLANESARDSFRDIAVYALIAGILYDE